MPPPRRGREPTTASDSVDDASTKIARRHWQEPGTREHAQISATLAPERKQAPPTTVVPPPSEATAAPGTPDAQPVETDDTARSTAIKVAQQQQDPVPQERPHIPTTITILQTSTGVREVTTVLPGGRFTITSVPFTTVVDVTVTTVAPAEPTIPAISASSTTGPASTAMIVGFSLAGLFFITSTLIAVFYLRSRLKHRRALEGHITPLVTLPSSTLAVPPQKVKVRIGKLITFRATVLPTASEPTDPFNDAHNIQHPQQPVRPSGLDDIMTETNTRRISAGSDSATSDATLPSYHSHRPIEPTRV